ncbi:hypothetical protein PMAYCL1PPCAC_31209, partial [Pristionchus mayeri]
RMDSEEEELSPVLQEEEKLRYGGAQAALSDEEEEGEEEEDDEEVDEASTYDENEVDVFRPARSPSANVRRRLEEAGRAKKAKKGFLTPERKKKLRKLLMMKAAEDLKEKQRQLELERSRVLNERIVPLPDMDEVDDLDAIFEEMKKHVLKLEADTYDINYSVRQKDFEINELTIAVNDLRGKFVKPTLKKVSKTENKFDKLKKKESTK